MGAAWTEIEKTALANAAEKAGTDVQQFKKLLRDGGCTRPVNAVYSRLSNKETRPPVVEADLITKLYKQARGREKKREEGTNPARIARRNGSAGEKSLKDHIEYIIRGARLGYHSADTALDRIESLLVNGSDDDAS